MNVNIEYLQLVRVVIQIVYSFMCWFLTEGMISIKTINPDSIFSFPRPNIYIEQKALDTIAFFCDGDARAGLNSLQLAVQAQVGLTRPNALAQERTPRDIVVKEEHVKEGLQRSHILYDKAGKTTCTHKLPYS